MPDMWHSPTRDNGIGNVDIWLFDNVVRHSPYFHANSTASIAAPTAFNRFNASIYAPVVDLVEIVLAGDAPLTVHDGKANL